MLLIKKRWPVNRITLNSSRLHRYLGIWNHFFRKYDIYDSMAYLLLTKPTKKWIFVLVFQRYRRNWNKIAKYFPKMSKIYKKCLIFERKLDTPLTLIMHCKIYTRYLWHEAESNVCIRHWKNAPNSKSRLENSLFTSLTWFLPPAPTS